MSTITALHSFGKSLTYLRELLADSVCWQAIVLRPDATYEQLLETIADEPASLDRATALAAIAVELFPTDQDDCDTVMSLPRILVRYDTDGRVSRETGVFERQQNILVLIETLVPREWHGYDGESFTNQAIDGHDKIGRIITDCNTVIQSGIAERLQVETWGLGPHGLIKPEEADGQWLRSCELHISFVGHC